MKKFLISCTLFFPVIITVFFIMRPLAAQPQTEKDAKSLVIGVERNYEPFSYLGINGELTGFDVELSYALCQRMNKICTIEPIRFQSLLPALRAGDIDLVVAGIGKTQERSREFAFSQTYYRSSSFFITNDTKFIRFPNEHISEMVIGVQKDSLQETFIRSKFVSRGAQMRVYSTYQQTVEAINKGEINMIFTDGIPGYAILNSPEGENLLIAGRPQLDLDGESHSSLTEAKIVARQQDAELINQVNAALLKLQAEGKYQELHARFFPFVNF